MFGLCFWDIAVILAYFLAVILIGFRSMSHVKNREDYFLAGRRFGKLIQTFAAFGQGTSSDTAVGVTTTTFVNGAAGTWSALNVLFATPIYWLTAPWYRRLRVMTLGDFFEERYGSMKMAAVYAVVQTMLFMLSLSLAFNALSKTVMAMTPKSPEHLTVAEQAEHDRAVELSELESTDYSLLTTAQRTRMDELRHENPRKVFSYIGKAALIWIVSIIVLIYAVAGGLEAAFITDTLQGTCIIILSILLIPFAFAKINLIYGGSGFIEPFRILHQKVPESFFDIFGSPSTIDFTWYYILALAIMNTVGVMVQANQLTANASARDEYTAGFGFTFGMYLKRICTLFWGLFALAAILLYGRSVRDPDMVWGHATLDLLAPLKIGLVGLMIACLMAAVMSTADCFMITTSGLLTHNIYRPLCPEKDEKSYVKTGRFFGAVTILGGAALALVFDRMFEQMKVIWEFGTIFAAPFWAGMLWRRANCRAAWISIIATLLIFFILPLVLPVLHPGLRYQPSLLKATSSETIERQYIARDIDVQERQEQIQQWQKLADAGMETGAMPQALAERQVFARKYLVPKKSIFWTKGIRPDKNGRLQGRGLLSLELVCYDSLGFDLSRNSYALNETLRILTRTFVPFFIIIFFSYITRQDDKSILDRFYVKMKTRVLADREADRRQLELAFANPKQLDHLKMFPASRLEITKWSASDIAGFLLSSLVAVCIVGLFYLLVNLGG